MPYNMLAQKREEKEIKEKKYGTYKQHVMGKEL